MLEFQLCWRCGRLFKLPIKLCEHKRKALFDMKDLFMSSEEANRIRLQEQYGLESHDRDSSKKRGINLICNLTFRSVACDLISALAF